MGAAYAAFVEVHVQEGVPRVEVLKHLHALHERFDREQPRPAAPAAPPGAATLADLSRWNEMT